MVEVIGCFETGRLLAKNWRSRFRTHCCSEADFDKGLATLVLGVRKHRGAYRLKSSCFGDFLSLMSGAGTELQGLDTGICATSSEAVTAWYCTRSIVDLDRKPLRSGRGQGGGEDVVNQWGREKLSLAHTSAALSSSLSTQHCILELDRILKIIPLP